MHQHPAYVALSALGRAHLSGNRPLASGAGHRLPEVRAEVGTDYEPKGELASGSAAPQHCQKRLLGQVALVLLADRYHLGVTQDPPLRTPEWRHRRMQQTLPAGFRQSHPALIRSAER